MTLVLVALCFALSGGCGLIYENVWIKQTGTVFGSTVVASTVVLSAFMAGLALGSWWIGRAGRRMQRPLRAYGLLELGITAAAFAFPAGLAAVRAAYDFVPARGMLGHVGLLVFELCAVAALMIVPTALMGATLPVLMRFALPWMRRSGRALGFLYAVNTAGAVVGSLVAGFALIPRLGLTGTSHVAEALNAVIGLVALGLSLAIGESTADEPEAEREPAERPRVSAMAASGTAVTARLIHLHVFLCGFAAMLYEIALMKLMPLVLGSSTYSFSLIVSAFITGIAIGSAVLGAWIGRARRPVSGLGLVLIGQGLAFMVSIPLYNHLPEAYIALRGVAQLPFPLFQAACFGLCFLVMVVPTFFLGGVLPIAAELVTRTGTVLDDVGRLYAANTVGNILGSIATGLVLVPHLGFKASMEVGIALNLASGLRLVWHDHGMSETGRRAVTAALALAVGIYVVCYPALDVLKLNLGVFRDTRMQSLVGHELLFAREDETCFVTVVNIMGVRSLRVNGKPDASNNRDMITQKMIAHWPLLARPGAKRALVVGLGSGVTAGTALLYPLKSVECVELSRGVVQASRFFNEWNHDVLSDPRLALSIDDGRNYLERAPGRYDVIVSEPSNPWIAGVGSLFTTEYFRAGAAHLAPGGVMAQWVQCYEMDDATFRTVLRTFTSVFPYVTLMQCRRLDVIMLGSLTPLGLDPDTLADRLAYDPVRRDLETMQLGTPLALAAQHLVPEGLVPGLCGPGPLNTDDHPVLEYMAPLGLYSGEESGLMPDAFLDSPRHLLRRLVAHHPPTRDEVLALLQSLEEGWPESTLAGLLADACTPPGGADVPEDAPLLTQLSRHARISHQRRAAVAAARRAAALRPHEPRVLYAELTAERDVEEGQSSFERVWSSPRAELAAEDWLAVQPGAVVPGAALGMARFRERRWAEAATTLDAVLQQGVQQAAQPTEILTWAYQRALARLRSGDEEGALREWAHLGLVDASAMPYPLSARVEFELERAVAERERRGRK